MKLEELQQKANELLKDLIQTQSFSGEEEHTAQLLENWMQDFGIQYERHLNNVWAKKRSF